MKIIYRSDRIGKNGHLFSMYKLRTMVENADKIGGSSTADNDPRITRIGKYLRKYKLDELPQLLNILKGDMTIIGWRPEVPEYLDTIHKEILTTKPGLTGLASLYDYDEGEVLSHANDPDDYYLKNILPKKRELDLYYVRNKSLKLDIQILITTILKICHLK